MGRGVADAVGRRASCGPGLRKAAPRPAGAAAANAAASKRFSVSAVPGALTTIAMLKEADAMPFLRRANCKYLLVDATGRILTNSQSTELEQGNADNSSHIRQ